MNRKHVGVLAGLVLVALAVWFFAFRDRAASTKPAEPQHARNGKIETPKPTAKADDTPAPQGMAPRWALDIDPEGPLRLEGQVVDEAGHGVGGAEVWLGSVPPRTAKSEDDGTFAFDKLVGREYALSATADERIGGPVEYKLTEKSDPVVIRLAKSAKVVVTVLAEDGKPIEGADVRLAAMGDRTARTAADGTATLKPVAPGWVAVQATADGYAPGTGFAQVGSAGAVGTIKVTLHKGVAVTGRVVDESGAPVAKAHMTTAGIWDLPSTTQCKSCNPVVTDTNGEFTFPALPAGTHTLVATDGEHAPARSAPVTVADQPVRNIKITMKEGGLLVGTVVDDQQKPVSFATVRIAGDGQQMWQVDARQATSDRAGKFELRGLARAKLKVRAESDGAASSIASVDLTSTAKSELKLVLDVKGTIAGSSSTMPMFSRVAEAQVNAFPDIMRWQRLEAISSPMSSATDGAGVHDLALALDGAIACVRRATAAIRPAHASEGRRQEREDHAGR